MTSVANGSPYPLYVLIPPSPLFAAHWSFFLPDPSDGLTLHPRESSVGRRIHVCGDRLHGFLLEIIRDYDISKHRSVGSRRFQNTFIPPQYVQREVGSAGEYQHPDSQLKDEDEGGGHVDNRPVDEFERVCVEIEAPGPSLKIVTKGDQNADGNGKKGEVKDCQWWIRHVIEAMTERDMLG